MKIGEKSKKKKDKKHLHRGLNPGPFQNSFSGPVLRPLDHGSIVICASFNCLYGRGFFSTPNLVILGRLSPKKRTFEVEKRTFFPQKADFFSQKWTLI